MPLEVSEGGNSVTATQTGGGAPAAIGVAIDVSRSMEGAPLAAAKQAAASFVKAKRTADSMAVYSFGHEANPVHGLDTDINALGSSLNQVHAGHRAGHRALRLRDPGQQRARRRTDADQGARGADRRRRHDEDQARRRRQGRQGRATSRSTRSRSAAASTRRSRRSPARPAVTSSRPTARAAGISAVYKQIGAEIRNTYRLQYHSHADGLVPLKVSLKGYTPATQKIDLTAPAAQIVAAGGTISKISKRSSAGLALAIVIGLLVLGVVLLMVRVPRETVLARRLDRYTTGERVVAGGARAGPLAAQPPRAAR